MVVNGIPRLCLFAVKTIEANSEIRYNYGDSCENLWWRLDVCIRATVDINMTDMGPFKKYLHSERGEVVP